MEWGQFAIFMVSTLGLFFWNRSESRTDIRHILSLIDAIQKEIKDFHGRLERHDAEFKSYIINEERNKK